MELEAQIRRAATWCAPSIDPFDAAVALVEDARSVVVLTGAGISTDSGIPDFRGPNGQWTQSPPAARPPAPNLSANPDARRQAWANRKRATVWAARPNDGHRALVELERRGILDLLVTQNTDGLHAAAGHAPERLVELHGSVHRTICLSCASTTATTAVLDRVGAGEDDPSCLAPVDDGWCGGILKVATVGFGQPIDGDALTHAVAAVRRADLLIAVGSTLTVDPAASLVPLACQRGAPVVIVNGAPTRHDALADVVLRGPIGVLLPRLVAAASPPRRQ